MNNYLESALKLQRLFEKMSVTSPAYSTIYPDQAYLSAVTHTNSIMGSEWYRQMTTMNRAVEAATRSAQTLLNLKAEMVLSTKIPQIAIPPLFSETLRNHIHNYDWLIPVGFQRMINEIERTRSLLPRSSISFPTDDTVCIENKTYSLDEINATVSQIFEEIQQDADDSEKNFWDLFFNALKKLKAPLRFLIINIVIPLIFVIYGPEMKSYMNDLIHEKPINKQEIIRTIKKETLHRFTTEQLYDLRLVTAKKLDVYEKPVQKSEFLDQIYLGFFVRVLERKRNWTRIEYSPRESDAIFSGWVFSRYLKRIKKGH